jgi:arylsulfatase A-like enzyme
MCEWFDEACGELLDYLDAKKLTENTVVLFLCDNGWAAASTNAGDPNQKLWKEYAQRSKSSPFENGIRTPIMVSWPGRVTPERPPDLAHAIDLFPTIAAATGLTAPARLYHLSEDPNEKRDVADQNPEIVSRLKDRIEVGGRVYPLPNRPGFTSS